MFKYKAKHLHMKTPLKSKGKQAWWSKQIGLVKVVGILHITQIGFTNHGRFNKL